MPSRNPFLVKGNLLIFALFVLSAEAMNQIRSGTAIVIFYSKQRVIFAGESRITLVGKDVSFSDDECKVFAFNKRFLFAASGVTGHDYLRGEIGIPWNGYEEAKRLAPKIPGETPDSVSVFANQWGEWMRTTLENELTRNEAQVLGHLRGTLLASAVFAGRSQNGEILVYTAILNCACNETPKRAVLRVDKQAPTTDSLPVAVLGPREAVQVFYEVLDGKTDRAKSEQEAWKAALPQDNSLAHDAGVTIRTLEFMIKNSGARDIGGPIDAIAMDSNGDVRWIQRKTNCNDKPSGSDR